MDLGGLRVLLEKQIVQICFDQWAKQASFVGQEIEMVMGRLENLE